MGRRQTDRYIEWAEYQNDQKTKQNLTGDSNAQITHCALYCQQRHDNSMLLYLLHHIFHVGLTFRRSGYFLSQRLQRTRDLKKIKILVQKLVLSFCTNWRNKFKNNISLSGAYQSYLKAECLLHRNHTKSSYSCNFLFLKCTYCPLVLFKVL